ncbi:unnamed protein product [Rotaria sordida]|uniref:Apple domain-containing protein n=1 Tax=Rotaria sordida TaxID=392033 RepID=A0A815F072_9BILA|nr:unnamed protein product [Rotaria sordida]
MFLYIGACLYPKKTKRRWYNKKHFIIPVSILTALLILAVVLGSTLGSKSTHNASANICDGFVRHENWDIYGNNISLVAGVIDYASCCSICQATKECAAFVYSPSSKECWTKKSVESGGIFNDKKISGYKVNVCNDFVRKDSCCSQCQATSGCIAFTYSPLSQRCSLKKSMGTGGNATGDSISGYYFYPLRGSSIDIHPNAQWQQDGITVAGGNGKGNSLNQLSLPWGLYVDDDETIYVADYENHRIMKWRSGATSGQVVAGGNGKGNGDNQLSNPYDVIVDKERDYLIICDSSNKRVVRWPRLDGTRGETIISNIGCWGLTMDEYGSLYVVDDDNNAVRRYKIGDAEGTVVAGGNGRGNRLNQFNGPRYVFVDRHYSVYVSERDNNRAMKWAEGAKYKRWASATNPLFRGSKVLMHLDIIIDCTDKLLARWRQIDDPTKTHLNMNEQTR